MDDNRKVTIPLKEYTQLKKLESLVINKATFYSLYNCSNIIDLRVYTKDDKLKHDLRENQKLGKSLTEALNKIKDLEANKVRYERIPKWLLRLFGIK